MRFPAHDLDRWSISRRRFVQLMSAGAGAVGAGMLIPGLDLHATQALPKAGTPRKVLILGAGMAGLAAAWELTEAGHDVTVIEARTRPGGRVHTLRDPFADDLHAEAGAVAFSTNYVNAMRYIDALGLERADWAFTPLASLYYVRGRRVVVRPDEPADWPYELTEEERRLGPFGVVQRYLVDTLPNGLREGGNWNQPELMRLDEMTLGQYMRAQGASRGATEMIRDTMWFGGAIESASALSSLRSDIGLFTLGAPFVLVGGNDQLPTAMADRLSEQIHYGVEVVGVHDRGTEVEVTTRRGDRIERLSADRVICTIPATVLRGIPFEPRFPADKRAAIFGMPYADGTRVYVQVSRGFWYDEGVTAAAATDLPIGDLLRHPAEDVGGPRQRAILESQVYGPRARTLGSRPDGEIFETALDQMEKVHPEIRKYEEGGTVWSWGREPYSLGCVSAPAPGDVSRYLEPLQRPHGRVHFAGEHTSILRSSIEGAIRSGIRAAREVSDAS